MKGFHETMHKVYRKLEDVCRDRYEKLKDEDERLYAEHRRKFLYAGERMEAAKYGSSEYHRWRLARIGESAGYWPKSNRRVDKIIKWNKRSCWFGEKAFEELKKTW